MVQSGNVEKVAIYGLDGTLWTTSAGFEISRDEIQAIVAGFGDSGKNTLASGGFKLCGDKYMYITSDDVQIQGRKAGGGASIAKSKMAVLIGTYNINIQPGNCRKVIENMKDYLLGVGY